jgi:transposase
MGRSVKIITVQESITELKQLHRSVAAHLKPRIQLLLQIKTGKAYSKQQLADVLGIGVASAQNWKKRYEKGGIEELLMFNRGGYKPAAVSDKAHKKLSERLHNPRTGFKSFLEIQQWLEAEFDIVMNYHAVNKYVKRKFGARLKVGRKSHVHKSPADEAVFKKPV